VVWANPGAEIDADTNGDPHRTQNRLNIAAGIPHAEQNFGPPIVVRAGPDVRGIVRGAGGAGLRLRDAMKTTRRMPTMTSKTKTPSAAPDPNWGDGVGRAVISKPSTIWSNVGP